MPNLALAQIRDNIRAYTDEADGYFITQAELTNYVNISLAALWDIIRSVDRDYGLTSYSFSTVNGTASYSLPSNFLELRGADVVRSDDTVITLTPYSFNDRNQYQNSPASVYNTYDSSFFKYLVGSNFTLIPTPTAVETVKLWFIPSVGYLEGDADLFNFVTYDWYNWVLNDVSVKIMTKNESDPSIYIIERERIEKRIKQTVSRRDSGIPKEAVDIDRLNGIWDGRYL